MRVGDLAPLAGLTGLEWLGLGKNAITDLTPLAALTDVTWLSLGDKPITDIGTLAALTSLDTLYVQSIAGPSDIRPLSTTPVSDRETSSSWRGPP